MGETRGATGCRNLDGLGQGLIDSQREKRACNSTYACRDGEMLVFNPLSLKPGQPPSKMDQNL